MIETRIVPVILSGGSGTRLWPVSRESFPKQLWPLISERTMIQETALRAVGPGFAPPVVVCNQEHRFLIAEQLRAAGVAGARIVLEPVGRNSAPAIAAAALLVAEDDPNAVLWMMAADASIADLPALQTALAAAVAAARTGRIVTFGMKPTAPEIGYVQLQNALAVQQHLAFQTGIADGLVNAVQVAEESGFPASRRPDQGRNALFGDLDINPMQRLERSIEEVKAHRLHLGPRAFGQLHEFMRLRSVFGERAHLDAGIWNGTHMRSGYPRWALAPLDKINLAEILAIRTSPRRTSPAAHAWRCQSSKGEIAWV